MLETSEHTAHVVNSISDKSFIIISDPWTFSVAHPKQNNWGVLLANLGARNRSSLQPAGLIPRWLWNHVEYTRLSRTW